MRRRILAVLAVTASVSALGGCALGAFGVAALLAAGAAIALGAFAACSGRRAADVESRTCLQVAPDVAPEPPDAPERGPCLTLPRPEPIPRTCLHASPPWLHGRLPIPPGAETPPPAVPLDADAEARLVDRGLLTGDQIARLRRLREG